MLESEKIAFSWVYLIKMKTFYEVNFFRDWKWVNFFLTKKYIFSMNFNQTFRFKANFKLELVYVSILLLNLTKNSNLWLGPRLFKTLDWKFSNYFWSNFPLNGKFWIQIYKSNKIWLDIKRFVLKFGWINRLLRSGFCHTFYLTFRKSIPKLKPKMSRLFNNLSSP